MGFECDDRKVFNKIYRIAFDLNFAGYTFYLSIPEIEILTIYIANRFILNRIEEGKLIRFLFGYFLILCRISFRRWRKAES